MDNKRINTILYSCGLTILCAILFMVFIILYRFNQRIDKIDELLAKSSTTLTMVNSSVQQVQSTAKSFKEQFDDPDTIKARKNGQLAITALAQHAAFVTLPNIDKTVEQVNKSGKTLDDLVSRTSNSLNDQIFPAITQTVLTTEMEIRETSSKIRKTSDTISAQYLVDSHEVATELTKLLQSGKISIDTFNKKSEDLIAHTDQTIVNLGLITDNLARTTAEFPAMAQHARKWQPIITGSRLVALLLSIFNP